MGLISPLDNSKTNNFSETPNFHQNLEMIELKPVNQLMMKSATTQPEPSPRPSKILSGNKIHMYVLYMPHRKFKITQKDKFQDQ